MQVNIECRVTDGSIADQEICRHLQPGQGGVELSEAAREIIVGFFSGERRVQ